MALADEAGLRTDPVRALQFSDHASWTARSVPGDRWRSPRSHNVALGGFSECSGLEMSMQVEEYKEGGRNGAVLKFPTRVNWTNITSSAG